MRMMSLVRRNHVRHTYTNDSDKEDDEYDFDEED
jgi:hypothetical protein